MREAVKMGERFIVDRRGKKRGVVLDLDTYDNLRSLSAVLDLRALLAEVERLRRSRCQDREALAALLEDIDDAIEVARRQGEETQPWKAVRGRLTPSK